jgi:hypothetical protein
VRALSISPFAVELLNGPPQLGVGLGHGHVLFGEHVITLTPEGRLRMPNGIGTDAVVARGEPALVGGGAFRTGAVAIGTGPMWDPQPRPRVALGLRPRPRLDLGRLAGYGPGLTPLGDDILVGFLAAAALAGSRPTAIACAAHAARRTTAISGTLLRLAARGSLPEAAHRLLVEGDPEPLLAFGASSGRGIAFGLAFHGIGTVDAAATATVGLGGVDLVIGLPTPQQADLVAARA